MQDESSGSASLEHVLWKVAEENASLEATVFTLECVLFLLFSCYGARIDR